MDRPTRRTLQEGVYQSIRNALMSGEFYPGTHLTVRDISEHIGTSSMPVRESFRRLVAEGALQLLSNGQIRVPMLTEQQFEEITEIRLVLEGLAARRAATRIADRDLRQLRSAADQFIEAHQQKLPVHQAAANERFHFIVYRASRSEELIRIIEHLWLQIGPCLVALISLVEHNVKDLHEQSLRHHEDIIVGLLQRDPGMSEAAIRTDIAKGAHFIRKYLPLLQSGDDRLPTRARTKEQHGTP